MNIINGQLGGYFINDDTIKITFPDNVVDSIHNVDFTSNEGLIKTGINIIINNSLKTVEFQLDRDWAETDTLKIKWFEITLKNTQENGIPYLTIQKQSVNDKKRIMIGKPYLEFEIEPHFIFTPDSLWNSVSMRLFEGGNQDFLKEGDSVFIRIPDALGVKWASYPSTINIDSTKSDKKNCVFVLNEDFTNSVQLSNIDFNVTDLSYPLPLLLDITGKDGNRVQEYNSQSIDSIQVSHCTITSLEDNKFIFHNTTSITKDIRITENGKSPSLGTFANSIYIKLPYINDGDSSLKWEDQNKISVLINDVRLESTIEVIESNSNSNILEITLAPDDLSGYSILDTITIKNLFISDFNDTTATDTTIHFNYSFLAGGNNNWTKRWHIHDPKEIKIGQPNVNISGNKNFAINDISRPIPEIRITDGPSDTFLHAGDTLKIVLHAGAGWIDTNNINLIGNANIESSNDSSLTIILSDTINSGITIRNLGYASNSVYYDSLEFFDLYVNRSQTVYPHYQHQFQSQHCLRSGQPQISLSENSVFVTSQLEDFMFPIKIKKDGKLGQLDIDTIKIYFPKDLEDISDIFPNEVLITPNPPDYTLYDSTSGCLNLIYSVIPDSVQLSGIKIKNIKYPMKRDIVSLSFSDRNHPINTTKNTIRIGNPKIHLDHDHVYRKEDPNPRSIGIITIKEDPLEAAITSKHNLRINLDDFNATIDSASFINLSTQSNVDSVKIVDLNKTLELFFDRDLSAGDTLSFSFDLKNFSGISDSTKILLNVVEQKSFYSDSTDYSLRIGDPQIVLSENRTYFVGDDKEALPDLFYIEDSTVSITDSYLNCNIQLPLGFTFDESVSISDLKFYTQVSNLLDSISYINSGKTIQLHWNSSLNLGDTLILSGLRLINFNDPIDFDTLSLSVHDQYHSIDHNDFAPKNDEGGLIGICDLIPDLSRNQLYFTNITDNQGINESIGMLLPTIIFKYDLSGANLFEYLDDSLILRIKFPENRSMGLIDVANAKFDYYIDGTPNSFQESTYTIFDSTNLIRLSLAYNEILNHAEYPDSISISNIYLNNSNNVFNLTRFSISANEEDNNYSYTDTTKKGLIFSNPDFDLNREFAYSIGDTSLRIEPTKIIISDTILISYLEIEDISTDTLIITISDSVNFEWNINNQNFSDKVYGKHLRIPINEIRNSFLNIDGSIDIHGSLFRKFNEVLPPSKLNLTLNTIGQVQRITSNEIRVGDPKVLPVYDDVFILEPGAIDTLHKIIIQEDSIACITQSDGITLRISDELTIEWCSDSLSRIKVSSSMTDDLTIDTVKTKTKIFGDSKKYLKIMFDRDLENREQIVLSNIYFIQSANEKSDRQNELKSTQIPKIDIAFNGLDDQYYFTVHTIADEYYVASPEIRSDSVQVFVYNQNSTFLNAIKIKNDPEYTAIWSNIEHSSSPHEYNIRIHIPDTVSMRFDTSACNLDSLLLTGTATDSNRISDLLWEEEGKVAVFVLSSDFAPNDSLMIYGLKVMDFIKPKSGQGYKLQYSLKNRDYSPFINKDFPKYISAPSIGLEHPYYLVPNNTFKIDSLQLADDPYNPILDTDVLLRFHLSKNSSVKWDTTMKYVQLSSPNNSNSWMNIDNRVIFNSANNDTVFSLKVRKPFSSSDTVYINGLRVRTSRNITTISDSIILKLDNNTLAQAYDNKNLYINPFIFTYDTTSTASMTFIKMDKEKSKRLPGLIIKSGYEIKENHKYPTPSSVIWLVIPEDPITSSTHKYLPAIWDSEKIKDSLNVRIGNLENNYKAELISDKILQIDIDTLSLDQPIAIDSLYVKNLIESSYDNLCCILDGYNKSFILRNDLIMAIGAPSIILDTNRVYEIHDTGEYLALPSIIINEDNIVKTLNLSEYDWYISFSNTSYSWDPTKINNSLVVSDIKSKIKLPDYVFEDQIVLDSLYFLPFNSISKEPIRVRLEYTEPYFSENKYNIVDSSDNFINVGQLEIGFEEFTLNPDMRYEPMTQKCLITFNSDTGEKVLLNNRVFILNLSDNNFQMKLPTDTSTDFFSDSITILNPFAKGDSIAIEFNHKQSIFNSNSVSGEIYLLISTNDGVHKNSVFLSDSSFSYQLPFYVKKPHFETINSISKITSIISKAHFNPGVINNNSATIDSSDFRVYAEPYSINNKSGHFQVNVSDLGVEVGILLEDNDIYEINKWYQKSILPRQKFSSGEKLKSKSPNSERILFADQILHRDFKDMSVFSNNRNPDMLFCSKNDSLLPNDWFFNTTDALIVNCDSLSDIWGKLGLMNCILLNRINEQNGTQLNDTLDFSKNQFDDGIYQIKIKPQVSSYPGIPIYRQFILDTEAPDTVIFYPLPGTAKNSKWGHTVSLNDTFKTFISDNIYLSSNGDSIKVAFSDTICSVLNNFELFPYIYSMDTISTNVPFDTTIIWEPIEVTSSDMFSNLGVDVNFNYSPISIPHFTFKDIVKENHIDIIDGITISTHISDRAGNIIRGQTGYKIDMSKHILSKEFFNYPNPFNAVLGETRFRYVLNEQVIEPIYLVILDASRQPVFMQKIDEGSTLTQPGIHTELFWDGKDMNNNYLASGVYFAFIKIGDDLINNKYRMTKIFIRN
ncbi:MAG: hypothetical protein JXB49_08725 [Bacteroidales bacterium]|nr:hypothetical protein [Bacteroidales bacterium]